jgi:hypothetical protein
LAIGNSREMIGASVYVCRPSMDIIYAYILGCIENKCKEAIKYR